MCKEDSINIMATDINRSAAMARLGKDLVLKHRNAYLTDAWLLCACWQAVDDVTTASVTRDWPMLWIGSLTHPRKTSPDEAG